MNFYDLLVRESPQTGRDHHPPTNAPDYAKVKSEYEELPKFVVQKRRENG